MKKFELWAEELTGKSLDSIILTLSKFNLLRVMNTLNEVLLYSY